MKLVSENVNLTVPSCLYGAVIGIEHDKEKPALIHQKNAEYERPYVRRLNEADESVRVK